MAIEIVGGVYCPLSPQDPQHRLHTLIQQTHCRLALVHYLTKNKFKDYIDLVSIDSLLNNNDKVISNVDIDRLSNVSISPENIAYIIFTSGSTGTPKAVSS
jgi:non-ribosomal peptide synthetase component F